MALDTAVSPAEAWDVIRRNAVNMKALSAQMRAALQAGNVTVEYVFKEVAFRIDNSMAQLNALAATAGLDTYVSVALGKVGYVATSEVAAVTAKQAEVLSWINANAAGLSLSGDSYSNWKANGSVASNRFGAAATAPLRALLTQLEALIA